MAVKTIARVMDFRGTYKGGGGPDKTVLNSAAQHDPTRVHVMVTYIRRPDDTDFQIPAMARTIGVEHFIDVPDAAVLDAACLNRLKRIILDNDLQLIHAHDDKTLLYAWLLKFMLPHINIMYTCHSHAVYSRRDFSSLRGYLSFKVRQKMQIFLMQRFPKPIITVSRDTKNRLVANGLSPKDVAVLHNGIDVDFWQRFAARPVLREELGIAADGLLVGTVARITYDKDLPTFYRVAAEVVRRHPKASFVIVGEGYGDELARAREDVARAGMADVVHFTGHRHDLRDVYASFDLFLMTSLTEGLPNTLLEAMAMGVPSVSTAVGGVPELLQEGAGGFLAPVGDVSGLADHVLRLLEDPELRARCGAACRRRIEERFSFQQRVRQMEAYYDFFSAVTPGESLASC